jgi:hypothetical protein
MQDLALDSIINSIFTVFFSHEIGSGGRKNTYYKEQFGRVND